MENNTKQKQNKNKTTTWALSCDFASPTCILYFRCKVLLWTIQSLRVGHFGQHSPYMWVTLDNTVPTCGSFWTTQSLRVGHFGQHSPYVWVILDNSPQSWFTLDNTVPTCGSFWTTQSPVVGHFRQHSPYVWVILDNTVPTSGVTLDNTVPTSEVTLDNSSYVWVFSDNSRYVVGHFRTTQSLFLGGGGGAQTLHRGSLWTTQTLVAGRFGQQSLRRGSLWTTQSPRRESCGTTSWVISDKTVPASGVTLDNTVPT